MSLVDRLVLASMRGGRVWVPWRTEPDVVEQLRAQGCDVVLSTVTVITWEASSTPSEVSA